MRRLAKSLFKILALLLSLMLAAAGLAVVWALFRSDRTFPLPYPESRVVSDPETLFRGRYLVFGPGHCADCHAAPSQKAEVDSGREAELSGGYAIKTFLGEMRAPNITSDSVTGIGRLSDGEIARFLRYGVDHLGRVGLPIMMYADLSPRDLTAILSFLRALPPVRYEVSPSRYNLLGKITKAFFLEPFAPRPGPQCVPEPGLTAAYGGYLANDVANCAACHTARNMQTGEFTGPRFAGGLVFRNASDTRLTVISPNLTPDPRTGRIAGWTREMFTARMKRGTPATWSPMPWGPFSRMTEEDIGAIYLYLMQLGPVQRNP